ncbi:MAG TPA: thiaminase II [Longimicrobiaceae bacterium]|nr:thiaminase II [Longimicrobiaceae bacterium]
MPDRAFDVPPFARECLEHAAGAWGASFEHPFVRGLAAGTLPAERFRFYQMQDARYLHAFSDACALISTRCPAPRDKLWFIDAARMALVVEGQLHAGYGRKLGYGADDVAALELTPNNRAYQDHMVSTALRGTLVEAVAAVAPCPWLYVELGQHLERSLGAVPDDHPYAEWLRTYADPGFNAYMDALLALLQRFADAADDAGRARARDAFLASVRYEWMFWQQAWEGQRWPAESPAGETAGAGR